MIYVVPLYNKKVTFFDFID